MTARTGLGPLEVAVLEAVATRHRFRSTARVLEALATRHRFRSTARVLEALERDHEGGARLAALLGT